MTRSSSERPIAVYLTMSELRAALDRIEARLQEVHPEITRIFLEAAALRRGHSEARRD